MRGRAPLDGLTADRDGLERLSRYLARPPLTTERLSLAPDGRVVYALRRHWKDGTSDGSRFMRFDGLPSFVPVRVCGMSASRLGPPGSRYPKPRVESRTAQGGRSP